nr:polysaccharide deacetylase family protein [Polaribacter marinus]
MRVFSKYIWRFSFNKKEIYLTFDDGPTIEVTEFVLRELQKHNAKATFFCIGKNITNHPEIFKKTLLEGHSIGNHTQNHLKGWKHSTEDYLKNVFECENIITNTIETTKNLTFKPQESKLFRPPYGKIKKSQAKKILKKGYKIIMWSVLSADFDLTITKEKCLENVLQNTKNGSIIVFHDSLKASEKLKYVLPKVLDFYSKKGFTFKAIC